jgi:hypothetical protein
MAIIVWNGYSIITPLAFPDFSNRKEKNSYHSLEDGFATAVERNQKSTEALKE